MTLQKKCISVSTRLSDLEHARQQEILGKALNERADEIDEVRPPFIAAMSSTNVLRDHGIVSDSRLPDCTKASERIASMRQQLAEEPKDITKGQSFNLMCRAVKRITEQCEMIATEAWKEHVKQTAPAIHKNLLNQFRGSPTHADAVFRIERTLGELRSLVRKPPGDTETLEQIDGKWEELRSDIGTLPVAEDPEIQAFLNAAISGEGAELELLTTTVKEWLDENNMLSDFCIRRSR